MKRMKMVARLKTRTFYLLASVYYMGLHLSISCVPTPQVLAVAEYGLPDYLSQPLFRCPTTPIIFSDPKHSF